MKLTQSTDNRNSLPRALRSLFFFPITVEGMACIAIAAVITLLLAPAVGRVVPDPGAAIPAVAGLFIVTLGVIGVVAHALSTRRQARADSRATNAGHPGGEA